MNVRERVYKGCVGESALACVGLFECMDLSVYVC